MPLPRTPSVFLPGILLAGILLSGCGTSGVESAVEVESLAACLDAAGASYDGAADWDDDEQLAFWAEPGTLACAVAELDEAQLGSALGDAFSDPDDTDHSTAMSRGQELAVRTLATELAGRGEDAAVDGVAAVIGAGWYENDDDSRLIRRLGAFTILVATGGTTGYGEFRRRNADSNLDDIQLDLAYMTDIWNHSAETERTTERLMSLSDAIADAT